MTTENEFDTSISELNQCLHLLSENEQYHSGSLSEVQQSIVYANEKLQTLKGNVKSTKDEIESLEGDLKQTLMSQLSNITDKYDIGQKSFVNYILGTYKYLSDHINKKTDVVVERYHPKDADVATIIRIFDDLLNSIEHKGKDIYPRNTQFIPNLELKRVGVDLDNRNLYESNLDLKNYHMERVVNMFTCFFIKINVGDRERGIHIYRHNVFPSNEIFVYEGDKLCNHHITQSPHNQHIYYISVDDGNDVILDNLQYSSELDEYVSGTERIKPLYGFFDLHKEGMYMQKVHKTVDFNEGLLMNPDMCNIGFFDKIIRHKEISNEGYVDIPKNAKLSYYLSNHSYDEIGIIYLKNKLPKKNDIVYVVGTRKIKGVTKRYHLKTCHLLLDKQFNNYFKTHISDHVYRLNMDEDDVFYIDGFRFSMKNDTFMTFSDVSKNLLDEYMLFITIDSDGLSKMCSSPINDPEIPMLNDVNLISYLYGVKNFNYKHKVYNWAVRDGDLDEFLMDIHSHNHHKLRGTDVSKIDYDVDGDHYDNFILNKKYPYIGKTHLGVPIDYTKIDTNKLLFDLRLVGPNLITTLFVHYCSELEGMRLLDVISVGNNLDYKQSILGNKCYDKLVSSALQDLSILKGVPFFKRQDYKYYSIVLDSYDDSTIIGHTDKNGFNKSRMTYRYDFDYKDENNLLDALHNNFLSTTYPIPHSNDRSPKLESMNFAPFDIGNNVSKTQIFRNDKEKSYSVITPFVSNNVTYTINIDGIISQGLRDEYHDFSQKVIDILT